MVALPAVAVLLTTLTPPEVMFATAWVAVETVPGAESASFSGISLGIIIFN